MCTSNCIGS